jgi:nitrogen-specific signal transduction histidine kinase
LASQHLPSVAISSQVILNLLLNAVEAMGSVEAAPRELLISTKQWRLPQLARRARTAVTGFHPLAAKAAPP